MRNEPYPLYKVEQINNLKEMVNITAEKYGNKPAFIFERNGETVQINYKQFKSDVEALGTAWFDMGIEHTKIALLGDNSYEWIVAYFATVNSGNVIVPLDKQLSVTEVQRLIDHSSAEVFIYTEVYADIAMHLREHCANISNYICADEIQQLIDAGNQLIQRGIKHVTEYNVDSSKLATLSYTSGTTGNPKGVMLSHKNLTTNAIANCQSVYFPDSSLLVLPLHHASGFMGVLCMLIYGNSIAINSSMKNLTSDFNKYQPAITVLVPLLIETFNKQIKAAAVKNNVEENIVAKQIFGSNLSYIISGGAPLDGKYVEEYLKYGITVLNVYGLTECSAIISDNRNNYFRVGSGGQVIPCCKVIISNPDENGQGEIYVKGDNIMLGYYKNEQATRNAFDGEWFKTGDIGYMDGDGFLFITGRKKNVIILSNGKNIYPEELEFALLNQIPYIKEAVVYEDNGTIAAEVFLDTENHFGCADCLNDDILSYNRTQPPHKNIEKVKIRNTEFPKTTTKKIKRQYGQGDIGNA